MTKLESDRNSVDEAAPLFGDEGVPHDVTSLQRDLGKTIVMYETSLSQYEALYVRSKAAIEKLENRNRELENKISEQSETLAAFVEEREKSTADTAKVVAESAAESAKTAAEFTVTSAAEIVRLTQIAANLRMSSNRAFAVLPTSVENLTEIEGLLTQWADRLHGVENGSVLVQAGRMIASRLRDETQTLKKLITLFRSDRETKL
jgi:hypothetical protein